MTGRHRGRTESGAAGDDARAGRARGRRGAVIAGVVAVPVLGASLLAFGMRDDPVRERPESATVRSVPPAAPEGEPTYEKFVPPDAAPQVATKAPERPPAPVVRPQRTARPSPAPTPTPTPPAWVRRPCPPGWEDVRWMRRWCERNEHRSR